MTTDEVRDWAEGWDVCADTAETAVRTAVPGEADETAATHTRAHARGDGAEQGRIPQWVRRLWQVAVGEWPSPWAARPASAAEALRYGRYGDYAAAGSRWRTAGTWYALLVAAPVTAGLSVVIWLVQRPGRLAALGLLVGLVWLFVGSGVPLTF